ncbi:MAG: hypothetical protein ABI678_11760 [Kofleriaceae bacterium]
MRLVAILLALGACQSSDVSREVGARCDTNAECDQKCLAPDGDWPGGFCTVLCDSDAECPEDTRCIEQDGGVCAFGCATDVDCAFLGDGYTCKERDSHGGGAKVSVCRGG